METDIFNTLVTLLCIIAMITVVIVTIAIVLFMIFVSKSSQKAAKISKRPVPSSTPKIRSLPGEKRIKVATEIVSVPLGVTIKIKRSRTIEHTIEVDWRMLGSSALGFQQFVTASIRTELELKLGGNYKQVEIKEYEIELNGNETNRYELIWTDVWLIGESEITIDNVIHELPFKFRKISELEVLHLQSK